MEPGLRDREYATEAISHLCPNEAAMEPGLRDREYRGGTRDSGTRGIMLQWSPVLETGNTRCSHLNGCASSAAMEPGLRDREYDLPAAS